MTALRSGLEAEPLNAPLFYGGGNHQHPQTEPSASVEGRESMPGTAFCCESELEQPRNSLGEAGGGYDHHKPRFRVCRCWAAAAGVEVGAPTGLLLGRWGHRSSGKLILQQMIRFRLSRLRNPAEPVVTQVLVGQDHRSPQQHRGFRWD